MALYTRRKVDVNRPIIDKTVQKTDASGFFQFGAETFNEVAQNNYRVGNALAVAESLDYAYANANTITEFNQLANTAIEKATKDTPLLNKEAVMGAFALKKYSYMGKMDTKIKLREDAQLIETTQKALDYSMKDYNQNIQNMYIGSTLRDDNAIKISRSAANIGLTSQKELTTFKTHSGDWVLDKKTREEIESGQSGHLEAFKSAVRGLSYDEAISYNSEIFVDREGFKEKTGINDATYDEMSKFMKKQLEQNKANSDAEIKSQAEFNAIRAMNNRDPEFLKKVMNSSDTPEGMKEALRQIDQIYKTPKSTTAVKDAFLLEKAIYAVNKALKAGADPTGLNKEKAMAEFVNQYGKVAQSSRIEEDEQKEIMDLGIRALVDSEYAQQLKDVFDGNDLFGQYTRRASLINKLPIGISGKTTAKVFNELMYTIGNPNRTPPELIENAQNKQHKWAQAILVALNAGATNESVKNMKMEANKEIMLAANSDKINNLDLNFLEAKRSNNEVAMFTLGGRKFEYLGLDSASSPILKEVK